MAPALPGAVGAERGRKQNCGENIVGRRTTTFPAPHQKGGNPESSVSFLARPETVGYPAEPGETRVAGNGARSPETPIDWPVLLSQRPH